MACFALYGILAGGIGKHASEMPPDQVSAAFLAWYVCELIYGPLSALIRTSIAVLILHFKPSKRQKWILHTCLGVMYIFTIIYFFFNLLQCSPPWYFWKKFEDPSMSGSCPHPHLLPTAAIAHSLIAAFSDFTISILSAFIIKQNMLNHRTMTTSGQGSQQSSTERKLIGLLRHKMTAKAKDIKENVKENKTKLVIMVFLLLGGA